MLFNLLSKAALPVGGKDVGIGEASLYALIGFLVVFAGIAFLIFVVWLVGKILSPAEGKQAKKEKEKNEEVVIPNVVLENTDEISEETVAVIMAALTAYYQTNQPKCEFTVKRIKRI